MKEFLKKHKIKLVAAAVIIAVLAGAFYIGGGSPGSRGWTAQNTQKTETNVQDSVKVQSSQKADAAGEDEQHIKDATDTTENEENDSGSQADMQMHRNDEMEAPDVIVPEPDYGSEAEPSPEPEPEPDEPVQVIDPETGKDKYNTDPVPEGKPIPVEPQDQVISSTTYTCTISISCATILNNMSWLDPEKVELVPEDGWLLEPLTVTFHDGESVFDVLSRVVKQNNIHMEYENTPMYNSAYIEGIGNLYEFDCGELSGWMYSVNDWFPNYGCSRYQVQNGDVIKWVYTCDLGYDVGGGYAAGG